MIVLIDNYDSFVHNLARYFCRLGQETVVVRNDQIDSSAIEALAPSAIVLSPGPCTPTEAGNSLDIVHDLYTRIPLLGVCLGHQTIAAALGANIARATQVMHGRTSEITHSAVSLFEGIPSPLTVCRYHSLVVDPETLPDDLHPTAWTGDGTLMAFEHDRHPVFGVQFHPEAILSEYGYELLTNFLTAADIPVAIGPQTLRKSELAIKTRPARKLPIGPVTF